MHWLTLLPNLVLSYHLMLPMSWDGMFLIISTISQQELPPTSHWWEVRHVSTWKMPLSSITNKAEGYGVKHANKKNHSGHTVAWRVVGTTASGKAYGVNSTLHITESCHPAEGQRDLPQHPRVHPAQHPVSSNSHSRYLENSCEKMLLPSSSPSLPSITVDFPSLMWSI